MRKRDSVSIVQKTVDQYADDQKKLTAELKRLIKDGQRSRDPLMEGLHAAIWPNCAILQMTIAEHFQTHSGL
ncbi:MAG: hypothetical protein J6Y57_00660 [Lachnospiraceae bacterium]|nr:hypothetical protein [Lachnospiraceae bacterium]